MKNITVQFWATTWIYAKALAVSHFHSIISNVNTMKNKNKNNLSYENSFDLPDHLVSGTHTGSQNIVWKLLKISYFNNEIIVPTSHKKIRDFRWNR